MSDNFHSSHSSIAFALMEKILSHNNKPSKEEILSTYIECIQAVMRPMQYESKLKKD